MSCTSAATKSTPHAVSAATVGLGCSCRREGLTETVLRTDESTPSIAKWLKDQGLTADGGYESFVERYQAIAHSKGRDVAGWEEIYKHFGTKLDKSTIIHQWLPGSTISTEATKNGARETQHPHGCADFEWLTGLSDDGLCLSRTDLRAVANE